MHSGVHLSANRAAWLMILHKLAPGTNPPYVAPPVRIPHSRMFRKGRMASVAQEAQMEWGGGLGSRTKQKGVCSKWNNSLEVHWRVWGVINNREGSLS